MSSTMGNLQTMMDNAGGRHMWYMICFIIFIFLLIYMMSGRSSTSVILPSDT